MPVALVCSGVRCRASVIWTTVVIVSFIGLRSFAFAADLPGLRDLLQHVRYPILSSRVPAVSMQARLQAIYGQVANYCSTKFEVGDNRFRRQWVCLFPNVLEEFDTVATILARGSSDPQRLLLTLAAGIHPNDMFATFDQAADEPAFDVLFARYLLAQRMLRELWPEVEAFLIANGKFQTPTDYFFEPWITAETPWAFAVRAVQRLNCQVPDQCALKQKLLSFLRVSLDWLDADPNLKARTAVDPSTAYRLSAGIANDPAARPIDSLIGAVLENRSAAYLFLAHDRSDLEGSFKQINEYLSHLNEDSIGLATLIVPSDKVCVDIPRLLQISLDKPWKLLSVPSPCDENNARRKLVQSLEFNGLLYRFNFFHLREVITYFYPNNRHRTPLQDSANQRRRAEFEAFSTIRALRILVANSGNNRALVSRRENRWKEPEGYSWAKPLISYLHDLFDAEGK
jgi:hypothetical protein